MKGHLYRYFMCCRLAFLGLVFYSLMIGLMIFVLADMAVTQARLTGEGLELFISITTLLYSLIFFVSLPTGAELLKLDEKTTTYSFYFSTPQSAKGLLLSKYYYFLLMNLGILFVCFLMDTVLMLFMREYAVSNLTSCLIFFSSQLMLLSIIIPSQIRSGTKSGSPAAAIYLFGFLSIIALYGLFGDISFFFTENKLLAIIEYLHSPKMIFISSLIPYVAVAMYYVSYRISLALYKKGVENYDQ